MESNLEPTVIYIVGSGHCGSTLLDMLLSSHSKIFGTGELTGIEKKAKGGDVLCTCGASVESCRVWGSVLPQIQGAKVGVHQKKLGLLLNSSKYYAKHKPIEASAYINEQKGVYKAIVDVTQKSILVDSTKIPERAILMEGSKEITPVLLHIVRDPRGVTWSYVRKYQRWLPFLFTWVLSNMKIEILKRRFGGKIITVRYEDLVQKPDAEIKRVLDELELSYERDILEYRSKEQHQIGGNRMRHKKNQTNITEDVSWQKDMPMILKVCTTLIALPLLGKYSYRTWL